MSQPESKLSRAIMTALRARGVWCMKIHGGPTMMAGAPDIIGCQRGVFFGIETKTPSGGDPTLIQQHVHECIYLSGGRVAVCRSVASALQFADEIDDLMDGVTKCIDRPTLWHGIPTKRKRSWRGPGRY
jgi:hypothetical protein